MSRRLLRVSLLWGTLLLGCRILPSPAPAPEQHDFGLTAVNIPADLIARLPPGLLLESITAPPWMSSTEVQYRFLFDQPTQLRSYAQTRWVAAPAILIEQELRRALDRAPSSSASGTPAPTLRLRLELETFEQQYASAQTARAIIRLRAELLSSEPGAAARRRTFVRSVTCQPDVQGAVRGLASVSGETLTDLVRWLADQGRSKSSSQRP